MWKVQLFKLNYDDLEIKAVADVVAGGWITMGEKTREFEAAFGEFLGGSATCAAVSNGTAALHMALLALGIGPGDEVIVPALTFVADLNVVKLVGATPVLVDVSSETDWNISPAGIDRALTPRTRAVIAVHYAGFPCDIDGIRAVLERRGKEFGHRICLIEDAAHAPGAAWQGSACGTLGDIGCFSFFTNKNLSVGEGGMVVSSDPDLGERLRLLRSHGMTALTLDRHQGRAISYDVVRPGLNYRIDEMRAALGLVQLAKLPAANRRRGELFLRYYELLADVPEVILPFRGLPHRTPAWHIFPVLLPETVDRLAVIESMKGDGIQTSIHYPEFQEFSAYKADGLADTPVARTISRRELTLPLYPTMTDEEVALVAGSLKKALGR